MYSRNRTPTPEERYRRNLPPQYSGSHFQYIRARESDGIRTTPAVAQFPVAATPVAIPSPVEAPLQNPLPADRPTIDADAAEADTPTVAESVEIPAKEERHPTGLLSPLGEIGQEELLLIAILLLLCAEHDRAMDIIVILLLLLNIR